MTSALRKMKVLVVLVLAGLVNVGYWYQLDKQHKDIAAKMEVAEQKNRELADVKARYLERQREAENYKRRVDVIDQLRAAQAGPVNLLNTIGETVNSTEAVWLNSMKDQGTSVDIDGMALSTDAVANLISNLQKTGYFPNIEIKETYQDDTFKEMQAFQFHLDLRKGEVLGRQKTMANFSEMSGIKQWAAVVGVAALLTGALYFTVFKTQREANATAQAALDAKLRENAELEAYRPKLVDIERQLASLKQQLEIERKIVPDEKEVPGFMKMMNAEAMKAGIELRRYTARPTAAKEFYTEVPFEMELDGPYYSMLNFFDQVGKLERIVNVSGLLVATTKKPTEAKAKHTYQYAPNESVVATCTATTFFSHDLAPPASAPGKPGQPAAAKKQGTI